MKPSLRPYLIYLILMGYLFCVKLAILFNPEVFRSTAQAAVFDWVFLLIWMAAGVIGVWLSQRTGFPDGWDRKIPLSGRMITPAAVGLILGVFAILIDLMTHWSEFVAGKMNLPSIHIPFPASLLVYPGGAIIVEVIYRLLPIPLLLWMVSTLLFKGRWQEQTFWALAILTSLIEPLGDLGLRSLGLGAMLAVFLQDYALNISQAYFFRKYGYISAILLRVAFYVVWHIGWERMQ